MINAYFVHARLKENNWGPVVLDKIPVEERKEMEVRR